VRAADGGTLFLDEIADLPKASQPALLRVLQEREVVPVGTTAAVSVDIRVLAATHQPLDLRVERGDFRCDLYARVAGCVVELPALRDRRDDLGTLVAALLTNLAPGDTGSNTFSPDVGLALVSYEWPMNVRELERCLSTCVVLAKDGQINASHLPPSVAAVLNPSPTVARRPSSGSLSEGTSGFGSICLDTCLAARGTSRTWPGRWASPGHRSTGGAGGSK
jgi:sigma-54 dependent transcriptional regulator, acetoin dehydrogenase operon transcriptional activator AcoR